MSKSRSSRASRKPLYIILALSLALSIGYVSLRPYFTPQSPQIMAIDPSISLTYGDTTVSGILQKDSPVAKPGNFILVLPDLRTIVLDVQGLDSLIGKPVSVSGNLSPAPDTNSAMTMTVTQVAIN